MKANYNTYSNPSYNTYVRDTLTRGLPTSTFMDLIQVPGEKYTYKMTY
ncbi:MAG: hypothetical protein Q8S84_05185 [bacterium]|nr:hypothetical protein [bacterium]